MANLLHYLHMLQLQEIALPRIPACGNRVEDGQGCNATAHRYQQLAAPQKHNDAARQLYVANESQTNELKSTSSGM